MAALLRCQRVASWTVLITPDEKAPPLTLNGWLKIERYDSMGMLDVGLALNNQFFQQHEFADSDWYTVLCDDDWLPDNYFDEIEQRVNAETEVIVTSMLRGQQTPDSGGHPTWKLTASAESLNYGFVGLEQGIFLGRALKNYRSKQPIALIDPNEAVLIRMAKAYRTQYLTDVFVWFNYLEPGRWSEANVAGMYD